MQSQPVSLFHDSLINLLCLFFLFPDNKKVAFTYGAITLARDEEKCDEDISEAIEVDDKPEYKSITPQNSEVVRFEVKLKNGEKLLLTDYKSCGKNWCGKRNKITVWCDDKGV